MIHFNKRSWQEYIQWQEEDKKTLKKINSLLKEICRDPFEGVGKPEPLVGNFAGLWSRRINSKDRLIYDVKDGEIYVVSLKSHYLDK